MSTAPHPQPREDPTTSYRSSFDSEPFFVETRSGSAALAYAFHAKRWRQQGAGPDAEICRRPDMSPAVTHGLPSSTAPRRQGERGQWGQEWACEPPRTVTHDCQVMRRMTAVMARPMRGSATGRPMATMVALAMTARLT